MKYISFLLISILCLCIGYCVKKNYLTPSPFISPPLVVKPGQIWAIVENDPDSDPYDDRYHGTIYIQIIDVKGKWHQYVNVFKDYDTLSKILLYSQKNSELRDERLLSKKDADYIKKKRHVKLEDSFEYKLKQLDKLLNK